MKQNKANASHARVLKMVQLALFAAIEVILTLVYIPAGTINLNFGLVPIVIAGIFLGPVAGALVGGVSGVVTMIQVLSGQGVFYAFLMAQNPIAACLLCIVKTAAAGALSGIVFSALKKLFKKNYSITATIVAAAVCPIVNTGIFALGMLSVFGKALVADPTFSGATTGGLFAIVFLVLIGINFYVELAVSVIVCPVLSGSLYASKLFNTTTK